MAAINVCRINGRTLRTSLVRHVTYSFLHGLVQGISFLSFFSIYTFFWSLIVEQKVIWPIWGLWHPNSIEMRLPGSTSLPLQAPSLSLPCHIWLLPIRLTMVAGVTRFPQLSLPSPLLSISIQCQPDASCSSGLQQAGSIIAFLLSFPACTSGATFTCREWWTMCQLSA